MTALLLWLLLGAIGFATLAVIATRPPADDDPRRFYDVERDGL